MKLPAPRWDAVTSSNISGVTIASWVLAAAALLVVLYLHLVPLVLTALLVFELVHILAPLLARHVADERAKLAAVGVLTVFIAAMLSAIAFGVVWFLNGHGGNLPALLAKMAEVLEDARDSLPEWIAGQVPASADGMKDTVVQALRSHAHDLRSFSAGLARTFAHIIIGLVVGAMIALHEALPMHAHAPLVAALLERAERLATAFRRVVFAQVRIAALNTIFTGFYLFVILPLAGVTLPFRKTLAMVTFIAGLLPVIGNLLSNTAIVVVSLAHSANVAIGSLVFLVLVHKLEYFLNAKIVGTRVHAQPWELILAMVLMEAAFGVPGVVAAPVYYAYLKSELADRGLV